MESDLTPTAIREGLSTRWLGRHYIYMPSIGSTNVALKEMAAAPATQQLPGGTLLLAEYQTRGRGRMDRSWSAAAGTSLLFSLLFRPTWPTSQLHWLVMIASLATAEAIESQGELEVGIKWPNDIVVRLQGVWHKIGGILVETETPATEQAPTVVLGIGLNVNMDQHQLPETMTPATSLLIATGGHHSRLSLLSELLSRLEAYYQEIDNGHSPQPVWRRRLVTLGHPVRVSVPGRPKPLVGIAEDIDAWGRLQVRDELGHLHLVAAGDVS